MKHLKLFQTEAEYTAYKNGDDFVTPNVSYAEYSTKVYYNPHTAAVISYNMVDLGLPSGLKWADRNVGAASPEDAGLYFAWGETVGYTAEQVANGEKNFDYNWSDYFDTTDGGSTFNKYALDKLTVLEAIDDAATVNMGSDWRMPTNTEYEELINNTTAIFIDIDGNEFSKSDAQSGAILKNNFKGIKFIGSNGNSIFIPATGYCDSTMLYGMNNDGRLWSSSLLTLTYNSQYVTCINLTYKGILQADSTRSRFYGQSVRGVCNK